MSGIKTKKRELLEEARQQAEELLRRSNATIERTIREIKESKADKEKTKTARKKIEALKEKVEQQKPKPENKSKQGSKAPAVPKVLRDFSELRALKGDFSAEPVTSPKSRSTSVSIAHKRTMSFERTLDLRGLRIDEATEQLIAYMDDALMVGAGEVTILHGTGTGALKQLTRDYLTDLNYRRRKRGQVALDFGDGDVNHGGAGLTIVRMG